MAEHILIATDLSSRSDMALHRASILAREWNAPCTIVHVVDDDKPKEIINRQIEEARLYLEEMIKNGSLWSGIACDIVIQSGTPHEIINAIAKERHSRVIVVGAHRKNILADLFRGTTTERILRTGKTPVLIARKPVDGEYDSVVFGVDCDAYTRHAIDAAFAFGMVDGMRITVVHAYQDLAAAQMSTTGFDEDALKKQEGVCHNENVDRIYNFLASTKLGDRNYRLVLEKTDPAQLIIKIAEDIDTDLIVVGTRSVNGIRKVMLGSVAEGLLHHAHSDVFVVPPQAA